MNNNSIFQYDELKEKRLVKLIDKGVQSAKPAHSQKEAKDRFDL